MPSRNTNILILGSSNYFMDSCLVSGMRNQGSITFDLQFLRNHYILFYSFYNFMVLQLHLAIYQPFGGHNNTWRSGILAIDRKPVFCCVLLSNRRPVHINLCHIVTKLDTNKSVIAWRQQSNNDWSGNVGQWSLALSEIKVNPYDWGSSYSLLTY